ncbi:MAG: hypothetical protein WCF12_07960 [Propionicimonas sp.]
MSRRAPIEDWQPALTIAVANACWKEAESARTNTCPAAITGAISGPDTVAIWAFNPQTRV